MSTDASGWHDRWAAATHAAIPGTRNERLTLLALLLLATALRFAGFPNIPYTHDEISALVRVDLPTLHDAIAKGIWNIDTHPPATHVFLWCWTKLFGFGDGVVKAPFMLMSIAALLLLYRCAYAWSGGPVALIATACMASMQYTVMYGQIARPYAMGFFTVALMADQLTRFVARGDRRTLVGFGIAGVLSAYTHHFALLEAAFIYLTGLFLVPANRRKAYWITGVVMVLCYLPNLPLFFAQLAWKGLDSWLTAPTAEWIPDYLWWIAHCSWLFALALGALVIAAFVMRIRSGGGSLPLIVITLVWGIAPLIIGYAYSVLRAPVLQYSVLLFSFPFVLIGTLAGLRAVNERSGIAFAAAVAVIATTTLIVTRKHYTLFLNSKYEAIVRGTDEAQRTGAFAVVDLPPEVLGFYRKLWCFTPSQAPCVNLSGAPPARLDSALRAATTGTLFYGQGPHAEPENVARIAAWFPFLVERHDLVEGQTFRFVSRPNGDRIDDLRCTIIATPEAVGGTHWRVDRDLPLVRDTARSYMPAPARWDLSGREYGIVLDSTVQGLIAQPNDVIEVIADVQQADSASDLALVVELRSGDSTVFYRADRWTDHPLFGSKGQLIVALKCADMHDRSPNVALRTYVWNPAKRMARIASVRLQVRKGDPVLYGSFRPLSGDLEFP